MEAEKRTNRASIDSEVCVLPRSSFVLEPDYADIEKRLWLSQSLLFTLKRTVAGTAAKATGTSKSAAG